MNYLAWLLVASLAFFLLERLRPERKDQSPLRPQLGNDLFYLLFNGHFYSVVAGGAVAWTAGQTKRGLANMDLLPAVRPLDETSLLVAALVYFVAADFLQWSIHVALHKVPLLWQFHKIHHSVVHMDWAGNFRYHWVENVVYRSLMFIPLTLILGGPVEALFPVWVIGTFWGHFNHSNLEIGLGPLGYVMNSPRMHMWHHDASTEGGVGKNYGIVLSLWDFLFKTAYWPKDRAPAKLGFPAVSHMPKGLPGQLLWPLLPTHSNSTPVPDERGN